MTAAFQAGTGVGLVVAVAVIGHDFADGFSTYTVASQYRNDRRRAISHCWPLTPLRPLPVRLSHWHLGFPSGYSMCICDFWRVFSCIRRAPTSCLEPFRASDLSDFGVHDRRCSVHAVDRWACELPSLRDFSPYRHAGLRGQI